MLHLASVVVTELKNWSCLLAVKPAMDLSSASGAQLMFQSVNWIKFLLSVDFGSQH